MLKTTSSALAIVAMLTAGAVAQSASTDAEVTTTTVPLETTTENAADAVGNAVEATGEAIEATGEAAAEAATDAAQATEQAVENAGDAVTNAAGEAVEATGDAVEATGDAATEAASDAADATGQAVENAGDAVEEATDAAAPAEGEQMETTTTEVEVQPADSNAEQVVESGGTDTAPVEGTPVEGQIFEQSEDSFLASSLLGARVQSSDGEGIGEVNDMILGADGSVEGVVIGVGGFLGIGEKDVAVQFDAIDVQQDAENGELTFVLSSTREDLEAAPEFRTQDQIRAEAEAEAATEIAPAGTDGAVVVEEAPANEAPATNN